MRAPQYVDAARTKLAEGGVCSVGVLAQRLGCSPSAAVRVFTYLEEHGEVVRVAGGFQRT